MVWLLLPIHKTQATHVIALQETLTPVAYVLHRENQCRGTWKGIHS